MSYRFLPWARQGLASRIENVDTLGPTIANRARFPIRVTVSSGDEAAVDLKLLGPGDVVGIDTREIIRTEPRRLARNVAPDQFAAIEFDHPDLPWMFTPAAAGANDRLRPWLVLVVVEKQPGVSIDVLRDRPLPRLTIEAPASPSAELPDLSESWAWAHTQLVEGSAPLPVEQALASQPDQNIARLLCPRRLRANQDYFACLVPAFASGRQAGLGQVPDAGDQTGAAWGGAGGIGASITLPLYFHWEFRTGAAGDFESLARRLVPRPVPDTVGKRRMYVGSSHPALPAVDPNEDAVLELEGALRAPEAGDSAPLPDTLDELVDTLVDIVNAPAQHIVDGASSSAEVVAPPIYGGAHVRVEELTGTQHKWLEELNRDPRNRAAAGLGAEIVRQNQERYMHAAWEQVGDVIAANARLDLARLMRQVMDRIHERHISPMAAASLVPFTAPIHHRSLVGEAVAVARRIAPSHLPNAVADPAFRRMTSNRSTVLRRAERHQGVTGTGSIGELGVVNELAKGGRVFDVLAGVPDGIADSRVLAALAAEPGANVGASIGALSTVSKGQVGEAAASVKELTVKPPPVTPKLRPDLLQTGILIGSGVDVVAGLPPAFDLGQVVGQVLDLNRTRLGGGLSFDLDDDGEIAPRITGGREIDPNLQRSTAPIRPNRGRIDPIQPDVVIPGGRPGSRPGGSVPGPLDPGPLVPSSPGRPGRPGPIDPGPLDPGPFDPGPIDPGPLDPGPKFPGPVRDVEIITAVDVAFDQHLEGLDLKVGSVRPPPAPINLEQVRVELVASMAPNNTIVSRAEHAISIADNRLTDGIASDLIRPRTPLDPIMVGPELPEPLYRALAAYDPDRFLPGIGAIPDDTITIVETNPRFVEAFLIGANHEMNRELLWRRYPTDRRGTPFRHFWDRPGNAVDIAPINTISRRLRLGTSTGADLEGSLALLVRGQLLRRFDAAVYAAPALPDGTINPDPALAVNGIFWGRVAPDVTFVGFDLTREDVENAPGWFFVIAEQPTEPQFGLDIGPGGALPTWSDLTWGHVGVEPGGHLHLGSSGLANELRPLADGGPDVTFGQNSAHLAAATFQRPFRAAIHSSELIEGAEGPQPTQSPVFAHAVLLHQNQIEGV